MFNIDSNYLYYVALAVMILSAILKYKWYWVYIIGWTISAIMISVLLFNTNVITGVVFTSIVAFLMGGNLYYKLIKKVEI